MACSCASAKAVGQPEAKRKFSALDVHIEVFCTDEHVREGAFENQTVVASDRCLDIYTRLRACVRRARRTQVLAYTCLVASSVSIGVSPPSEQVARAGADAGSGVGAASVCAGLQQATGRRCRPHSALQQRREVGMVATLFPDKGYGFVAPDAGEDLYFRLPRHVDLRRGDRVSYKVQRACSWSRATGVEVAPASTWQSQSSPSPFLSAASSLEEFVCFQRLPLFSPPARVHAHQ